MDVATPDIRHEESGTTSMGRAAADRSIARSSDRAPAPARAVARNLVVAAAIYSSRPLASKDSRKFRVILALKLESFLEPRAFWIWNRKQAIVPSQTLMAKGPIVRDIDGVDPREVLSQRMPYALTVPLERVSLNFPRNSPTIRPAQGASSRHT